MPVQANDSVGSLDRVEQIQHALRRPLRIDLFVPEELTVHGGDGYFEHSTRRWSVWMAEANAESGPPTIGERGVVRKARFLLELPGPVHPKVEKVLTHSVRLSA